MNLDESLRAVLAEQPKYPQCITCKLVASGKVTDDWLAENVAAHGAKKVSLALERSYPDAKVPIDDAIRNHLRRHVA